MRSNYKVNEQKLVEMYASGETMVEIAAEFDCTPTAIHYALTRAGVERDRLRNRGKYAMTISAIRQRLVRAKARLEIALEDGCAADIRFWGEQVQEEKRSQAEYHLRKKLTEVEELQRYVKEA